jgi:hypothetical protein
MGYVWIMALLMGFCGLTGRNSERDISFLSLLALVLILLELNKLRTRLFEQ